MGFPSGDIKLSNNFELNASLPLDARMQVTNYSDLASISFKWAGMPVFVVSDNKWYNLKADLTTWTTLGGSLIDDTTTSSSYTWSSSKINSVLGSYFTGTGSTGYIPYFGSSNTLSVSSVFYDTATFKGTYNSVDIFSFKYSAIVGAGTVTGTINTTTVTGSGTSFTTFYNIGDTILIGSDTYTVVNITSDTSLTVGSYLKSNYSSSSYSRRSPFGTFISPFDSSGFIKLSAKNAIVVKNSDTTAPLSTNSFVTAPQILSMYNGSGTNILNIRSSGDIYGAGRLFLGSTSYLTATSGMVTFVAPPITSGTTPYTIRLVNQSDVTGYLNVGINSFNSTLFDASASNLLFFNFNSGGAIILGRENASSRVVIGSALSNTGLAKLHVAGVNNGRYLAVTAASSTTLLLSMMANGQVGINLDNSAAVLGVKGISSGGALPIFDLWDYSANLVFDVSKEGFITHTYTYQIPIGGGTATAYGIKTNGTLLAGNVNDVLIGLWITNTYNLGAYSGAIGYGIKQDATNVYNYFGGKLLFPSQSLLGTPKNGVLENDGTDLWWTNWSGSRLKVTNQGAGGTISGLTTSKFPYATSSTSLGNTDVAWDATNSAIVIGGSTQANGEKLRVAGRSRLEGVVAKLAGNSTKEAKVGGVLWDSYSDIGSVSTTETDIFSITLDANMLYANGEMIKGEFVLALASNANNKHIKAYLGGMLLFDSGITTVGSEYYYLNIFIIRKDATTVRAFISHKFSSTVAPVLDYIEITGFDFTMSNIFKITGQGIADNDLVGLLGYTSYMPNYVS